MPGTACVRREEKIRKQMMQDMYISVMPKLKISDLFNSDSAKLLKGNRVEGNHKSQRHKIQLNSFRVNYIFRIQSFNRLNKSCAG